MLSKNEIYLKVLNIGIIFMPYTFLSFSSVNFTVFDFFLILSGFLFIVFTFEKILFNKEFLKIYVLSMLFLSVVMLPFYKQSFSFSNMAVLFQYFFIFLWMFPLIFFGFDWNYNLVGFRRMSFFWVIYLILNIFLLSNEKYYISGRFSGFYSNPGTFGIIISVMFPWIVTGFLEGRGRLRVVYFLGGIISVFLLVATGSRAGLAALITGFLVYLNLSVKKSLKNSVKYVFLFVISFFGIKFFFNKVILRRNIIQRLGQLENISVRLNDYRVASKIFIENVLTGVGLQNSYDQMIINGGKHRPHNLFVAYALETGLLGLFLLASILFPGFYWILKNMGNNFHEDKKIQKCFGAIGANVMGIFVAFQFTAPSVHRCFWFVLGLSILVGIEKIYNKEVKCVIQD